MWRTVWNRLGGVRGASALAVTASIVAPNSHDSAADPWVLGGGAITLVIAGLLVRHVLHKQGR